jgi:hypothetical protein
MVVIYVIRAEIVVLDAQYAEAKRIRSKEVNR